MNQRGSTAAVIAWLLLVPGVFVAEAAQAAAHSAPQAGSARELTRAGGALRTALKGTDVTLEKTGGELVMRMPAATMFEPDSSSLRAGTAGFRPLADLGKVLKRYKGVAAEIRLYTDVIGGAGANRTLSDARAHAIAQALQAIGVSAAQLTPHGLGATLPVAPNDSAEGRRANRRVEIVLSAEKPAEKPND
jgi:outer membrane protein OmpA-like peptidoglycan-associated protein